MRGPEGVAVSRSPAPSGPRLAKVPMDLPFRRAKPARDPQLAGSRAICCFAEPSTRRIPSLRDPERLSVSQSQMHPKGPPARGVPRELPFCRARCTRGCCRSAREPDRETASQLPYGAWLRNPASRGLASPNAYGSVWLPPLRWGASPPKPPGAAEGCRGWPPPKPPVTAEGRRRGRPSTAACRSSAISLRPSAAAAAFPAPGRGAGSCCRRRCR